MKKLFLTGAAALLIVATGCKGGTQQEKELAAQQDTLSMAIAEMFAADYARQTMYMPDSLQFDKAEFLKGVQAALAADTTLAGQSYLAGLQQGIQMNMVIESIAKQNDIELDKSDILEAFKKTIAPDSIAASAEQANNKAMTALRKIKEIKLADDPKAMTNKKRSADFMADLKKQANARSLSDNVVCVTETVGEGAKVNASDIVRIKYTMTSMLSKQQLDRTGDNPREMQPAQFGGIDPALAEGITSMNRGGKSVFYVQLDAVANEPYDIIECEIEILPDEAPEATSAE